MKKENEEIINELQDKGLQLLESAIIKGYDKHADTMFAARLIKN